MGCYYYYYLEGGSMGDKNWEIKGRTGKVVARKTRTYNTEKWLMSQ